MSKKKITKIQKQELIQEYTNGTSIKDLAIKYSMHNNSISRIIKEFNIPKNNKRISNEEIEFIINEYKNGKSSLIIANILDVNASTITRILQKNNIKIKSERQKYNINYEYFAEIDSKDKAYFLGLLYNNIDTFKTNIHLKLSLKLENKYILKHFSNNIYGFDKIKYDNIEMCYIDIFSKDLIDNLIKNGCKSTKLSFPNIAQNLLPQFLLGYLDGTNAIYESEEGLDLYFISGINFIERLDNYLKNNNIKFSNFERRLQIHEKSEIEKLYNLMYNDSNLYFKSNEKIIKDFINSKNIIISKTNKQDDFSKYGTTYTIDYNGTKLTIENIKKMSIDDKKKAAEFSRDFYRKNGFPYPKLTDNELVNKFNLLRNADEMSILENNNILRINNQNGVSIFKHFAPQYFEVKTSANLNKPSILETFNNDDLLYKVILNRLSRGHQIDSNQLRQGCANSKIATRASIFNCVVAKYIYSKYTKENDIIYDYSMGFGQRLLGSLALPYKTTYVAVDPMKKNVESNQNIFNFFSEKMPALNKEIDLYCEGSENFCNSKYHGKVNLAFSSPPYFNLEVYSNENTQAYSDGSYSNFINKWWRQTVQNIDKMLTKDGTFILNIKDKLDNFNLGEDMCNIIKEKGFELIDTYKIQLSSNVKFNNKTGEIKYEPIYVFKRK